MWASYLLAFAFALSPMTATRGESAIGPIDIVLILAAGYSLAESFAMAGSKRTLATNHAMNMKMSPTQNPVFIFWGLALVLLTISMLLNFQESIYDPAKIITVYGPYVVNFLMVAGLANEIHKGRIEFIVKGFIVASALIGLLYLAAIALSIDSFYYYGIRFSGLSLNPNQTGLHSISIIIVASLYINKFRSRQKSMDYIAFFAMGSALVFGMSSKSDTFVASAALVGAGLITKLGLHYIKTSLVKFVSGFFVLVSLAASIYFVNVRVFDAMVGDAVQQIQYADQDVVRFLLWQNGIEAWKENLIFGNGPGAWSGVAGPFLLKEAHNTFIDWLSIAGILGTLLYFWLLLQIFRLNIERHLLSYSALAALLAFSSFHYIFRLPIFWLAMLVVMIPEIRSVVGENRSKKSAPIRRPRLTSPV